MRKPNHHLLRKGPNSDTVILQFRGSVGWRLDASSFSAAMDEAEENYKVVEIDVNSPGGSTGEGMEMYNRVRTCPIKTVSKCVSIAASMASAIMMGADEVVMCETSLMMIHEPWTFTYGNADELRKEADTLEKFSKTLAKTYESKTKLPEEEIAALLKAETWFTPEEALKKGFIDRIDKGGDTQEAIAKFAAMGKKEIVNYARSLDNKSETEPVPPTKVSADIKSQLKNMDKIALASMLGMGATASEAEILAKCKATLDENTTLKNELKEVQDKNSAQLEARIKSSIDKALSEGRIVETDRAMYESLGRHDMALFEQTIAARPAHASALPNVVKQVSSGDVNERQSWSLTDWQSKDPSGLEALQRDDPDQFKKLLE